MAGRFLFDKLASRVSRSRSLLGAQAPAQITRRASEGGERTLTKFSHGRSTTEIPNHPVIHGYPVRYLSTFTRLSKRSSPPKFLPPVTTSGTKPALVDYAKVKRHFSTSPSAKGAKYCDEHLSPHHAESKAKLDPDLAALEARWIKEDADFMRFMTMIIGCWAFNGVVYISTWGSESSCGDAVCCKCGRSCSRCHSRAAGANVGGHHPDVQWKSGTPDSRFYK